MNPNSRNRREGGAVATKSPTNLEIAWSAGVFEGEGHLQIASTQNLTMTQCDKWVVDKFLSFFGGRIYTVVPKGISKKIAYRWYAGGERARGIIQTWYPFLSPRLQVRVEEGLKI